MIGGIRAPASTTTIRIPNNVRKMIQNLKEIHLNHTDDEIYSMLKECSMDPNETAQKLLHQDTFHEVKRRRDRKLETIEEIAESRRSSSSGRGGRGGRGNHSSCYLAHDAGDRRKASFVKENRFSHPSGKAGSISSPHVARRGKRKDKGSSVTDVANGPIGVLSGGTNNADTSNVLPGTAVCSSALDPVLVPTNDTRVPAAGVIKREFTSQRAHVEQKPNAGKMGDKSQGSGKNQATEVVQSSSLNHGSSSSSRPSSNYGSWSQQGMGSQKAGPAKEWKPKPINTNTLHVSKASHESNILVENSSHSQPVERTIVSEEATNKLQQELDNLRVRDYQHVIIPNHIHVPDAVRTSISFGSFDTGFVLSPKNSTETQNEDLQTVSLSHQDKEDTVEEQASSQDPLKPAEETDFADNSSTPEQAVTLSSADTSVPSSSMEVSNKSIETTSVPPNSSVHNSESYSFGVSPPVLGNQLGQKGASENQARDVSGAAGFVGQQSLDPSSLYAQFYRSTSDSDGRVSPFANHGVASKYSALSSQSSQSLSEGGNSSAFLTPATPHETLAAGVIPNSVAVTQQPLPILRQPAGIYMPSYPPNFIPYGHYFSPFYFPPPAMHHFLTNNAFPQQAQAGSLYPSPPATATAPVKYPFSQYKPGNSAGNSSHMGVSGGYGPYGVPPTGYNPGTAVAAGNSTANEELASSQFKDNVYITGQQTESPAVWFSGPGRDVPSLPTNAFYNLPPRSQHVSYGLTQVSQCTYPGMFHTGQAVSATARPLLQQSQPMPGAVDMVGPTSSIYQQPQHPQMNWPNNYRS